MAFQVPARGNDEQFEFKIPGDDTVYRLPKLKNLSVATMEEVASSTNQFVGFLALFGDPESDVAKSVRSLNAGQLEALMAAWADDSGVNLGEFMASSGS